MTDKISVLRGATLDPLDSLRRIEWIAENAARSIEAALRSGTLETWRTLNVDRDLHNIATLAYNTINVHGGEHLT